MMELVARPHRGRRYSAPRTVRVSDAGPDGALRLDGVARYLQDVATDDWLDAGLSAEDTWVVRRAYVELAQDGRWPRYGEEITAVTWCSGTGPAWAERRTDLELGGQVMVRANALWVLVDKAGRPLRLGESFHEVYGEACGGRKASGRVPAAPTTDEVVAQGASRQLWAVRKADIDVVGHVNNAAIWSAVVETAPVGVRAVDLVHHGPVDASGGVSLSWWPGHFCLLATLGRTTGAMTASDDDLEDNEIRRGEGPPELAVRASATLSA